MLTWCIIALIRLYQRMISPFLGQRCRFVPTCSSYAIEAITLHGLYRGGLLAVKRLSRCHPVKFLGGRWGFDPVPKNTLSPDS